MLSLAQITDDLHLALALIRGQTLPAEHIQQPTTRLLEQRPREPVDVHR